MLSKIVRNSSVDEASKSTDTQCGYILIFTFVNY